MCGKYAFFYSIQASQFADEHNSRSGHRAYSIIIAGPTT